MLWSVWMSSLHPSFLSHRYYYFFFLFSLKDTACAVVVWNYTSEHIENSMLRLQCCNLSMGVFKAGFSNKKKILWDFVWSLTLISLSRLLVQNLWHCWKTCLISSQVSFIFLFSVGLICYLGFQDTEKPLIPQFFSTNWF